MTDLHDQILQARFTQTIDGLPVATAFEGVIDPATAAVFQQSPVASDAEVDAAVTAARRAQPAWAALSWDERERYLGALADAMDAHVAWLAAVQSQEQGMAIAGSTFAVRYAAISLRILGTVRAPDRVLRDDAKIQVTERWCPLGVVAAIAPWNGPILLGMQKVATALIGGNTVVLKPSELTPLATLEVGRIARAVLPAGVFNVIGGGRSVGQALVGHAGVDKVSFTGSTATGVSIAKQSSAFLRPVTLELGGNDAAILLPDGSIPDLVAEIVRTGLANRGQFCAGIKRVYVPTALYGAVCDALTVAAEQIGELSPIQNKAQFDKICGYVEDAKANGGRILIGGAPLDRPGYFYPATVVADLTDGTRLVDEEQFGPVVPIIAYDDLDAVIATVNAGIYGLTGSIWTTDLAHGEAVAARLTVGTGWVNQHGMFDPEIPMPLIKASGMGVDYADHGVRGAMRLQIINARKPS
jgi:acyl-CoA reductase-like NAD-dependent aldehyde dehydrogenase